MKVSSCEILDQSGNECAFVRRLHPINGSDSVGQLDMQLRTSTEAIDFINIRQGFGGTN